MPAVRGPGGAFGAEVVTALADDECHRNTYVLDSSCTAGGQGIDRAQGAIKHPRSFSVVSSRLGMVDGHKRIGLVTSHHGRFFSIRDSRSSSRSLHFDQTSI
jgi:hypothetical protein